MLDGDNMKKLLTTIVFLLLTPLMAQAGDPPSTNAVPNMALGAIGDLTGSFAQISDPFSRRLPRYATPFSCDSSKAGYMYYDTDDTLPYYCNGTSWTLYSTISSTPSFTTVTAGSFISSSSNPSSATTGLRCANNETCLSGRNAANSGNNTLKWDASDVAVFSGAVQATSFTATSGASGTVPILLYSSNCTTGGNCATQADTTGTGGNFNSSNGTAGTSELIFAMQYTVPAGYIVSGKVITVCWVIEQTVGASSPNATMRMKLGGTNVYATSTTILTINNASARGSTTCIPIQGTAAAANPANIEVGGMFTPVLTQQAVMNSVAQPVSTLNTLGTLSLQLSWQWATNPGAGYSVTLRQLWIVGY